MCALLFLEKAFEIFGVSKKDEKKEHIKSESGIMHFSNEKLEPNKNCEFTNETRPFHFNGKQNKIWFSIRYVDQFYEFMHVSVYLYIK